MQLLYVLLGSRIDQTEYFQCETVVADPYLSFDIRKTICFPCDYVFFIFSCIENEFDPHNNQVAIITHQDLNQ